MVVVAVILITLTIKMSAEKFLGEFYFWGCPPLIRLLYTVFALCFGIIPIYLLSKDSPLILGYYIVILPIYCVALLCAYLLKKNTSPHS